VIGPSCCQHQWRDTPRPPAEINVRACVDERCGASDHIFLYASRPTKLPAQNKKRRRATILTLRDDTIGIRIGGKDAF
jgi:hypothetical protein